MFFFFIYLVIAFGEYNCYQLIDCFVVSRQNEKVRANHTVDGQTTLKSFAVTSHARDCTKDPTRVCTLILVQTTSISVLGYGHKKQFHRHHCSSFLRLSAIHLSLSLDSVVAVSQ